MSLELLAAPTCCPALGTPSPPPWPPPVLRHRGLVPPVSGPRHRPFPLQGLPCSAAVPHLRGLPPRFRVSPNTLVSSQDLSHAAGRPVRSAFCSLSLLSSNSTQPRPPATAPYTCHSASSRCTLGTRSASHCRAGLGPTLIGAQPPGQDGAGATGGLAASTPENPKVCLQLPSHTHAPPERSGCPGGGHTDARQAFVCL